MTKKPKVAFFDFAGCEGDQLQIANLEEKVLDLLDLVEIVSFREIMKEHSDDYDVAFIEGSIQRPIDEERLKEIRSNADMIVAFGDCASNGCVNKLQKDWTIDEVEEEVYPEADKEDINENDLFDNFTTKAVDEVVDVDYYLRGCPVRGERFLHFVKRLVKKPVETNKDIDFKVMLRDKEIDERSLVNYNPNKCILCRRCANVCQDVLGVDALGPVERGWETIISTPQDIGFDANGCIQCGQCVAVCPVDSLYTESPVDNLCEELENKKNEFTIALDSIALASFIQEHATLREMDPIQAEKYVIAGLRKLGFDKVLQYEKFLAMSQEKDERAEYPLLASWCLPARNHIEAENMGVLEVEEKNSPWNILLSEKDGKVCLMSPCSGLKSLEELDYVISSPELQDLFNGMDLDIGFVDHSKGEYDELVADNVFKHPGIPDEKESFNITEGLEEELLDSDLEKGPVDVFPCLNGCLSGGGNYPTTKESKIKERVDLARKLREVE